MVTPEVNSDDITRVGRAAKIVGELLIGKKGGRLDHEKSFCARAYRGFMKKGETALYWIGG